MNDKELEKILNFVLNNLGNDSMMKIEHLQKTAQIYYLKCEELEQKLSDSESDWIKMRNVAEKVQAQNIKLKECVEFYADFKNDNPDNDWNNDYARQVLKELDI